MKSKNILNIIKNNFKTIACSGILGLTCVVSGFFLEDNLKDVSYSDNLEIKDVNDVNNITWVESDNWLITSYGNVNEDLYSGNKIKIFNRFDEFLGLYKEDFLYWVRINGSGIGDGIRNDKTKFLNYDYEIDDGITHYFTDTPLGAYNNEIFSWLKNNPSVALNPPLPYGTRIRFNQIC